MRTKKIIVSAFILTTAGIITRILGFFYRIYMSNTIGAEGVGIYQLVVSLYSLAWSISCSGFTTTISKSISAEKAKGMYGNIGRILKQGVAITSSIALVVSVITYTNADYIANVLLDDGRISIPLKVISLSFPFMAAGSVIRGYFFGLHKSSIPAISQVLEQLIRIITVMLLMNYFINKSLVFSITIAIIGIVAGEIISFAYVIISYKFFKAKNMYITKPTLSSFASLTIILSSAIPLTLNRVSSSILMTIENALIPQQLQLYGLSKTEALATYGKITGMTIPLVFFPTAFLIALSISLVPAVSESVALKKHKTIIPIITKSILLASILGIGASGFFIVFAKELGFLIFKQDITEMLINLGFMSTFVYLQIILSAILNGLGKQVYIFIFSILSSIITISFVYIAVPIYGVNGFIFGWFLAISFNCFAYYIKVKKETNMKIGLFKLFVLPILSSLCSALILNLFGKKILMSYFGSGFGLLISVFVFAIIYFIFVVYSGCIDWKDIKSLVVPKRKYKST